MEAAHLERLRAARGPLHDTLEKADYGTAKGPIGGCQGFREGGGVHGGHGGFLGQ